MRSRLLHLALILALICPATASAAAPRCEIDRPVRVGGLDWDSNRFHAAVAAYILEHGFGCDTEIVPGTTIPLLTGLGRGDVDVMMEVWKDQITEAWEKAEAAGTVTLLGVNYPDAAQGWFVPRYLVEGPDAPAPDLTHVDDLPRYKDLFRDPEEPDKGRFYNCKLGWNCEAVNTRKLRIYGLDAHFTNFRSGSGAALSAAIASAYERERPILYYHWEPTWIVAKYDGVMLREPPYDPEVWQQLADSDRPTRATAYPAVTVHTGANTAFVEAAPKIARFLTAYRTSSRTVSEALLYMQENETAGSEGAALHFLASQPETWSQWLPEPVADRVAAALP